MYGLLLLNMQEYVIKTYGNKAWQDLSKALKIAQVCKIVL